MVSTTESSASPSPSVVVRAGCVGALLGLAAFAAPAWPQAASVVERPPLAGPAHYVANRSPLRPSPFLELPIGAVRARGWLRACLERQRDGLTGNLGSLSAWLQKEDNAWLSPDGSGAWGWEEVPYWLKGYGELAYLLDDPAMLAETRVWVEGALASQREDGDFGPVRRFADGTQDFWANMVMLSCLQSFHDFTGDARVPALMERYFRYQLTVSDDAFLTHYWQRMRGGDNLYSVYWLYNRTGQPWLLELAAKLHRNTVDWGRHGALPDWHNVNIAQGFREPATWYLQSQDRADLEATYRAFHLVRDLYGQVPGGMFGSDEDCRPGFDDPRQAIETCGMVEQLASDELLFRITGDPFWADHCEEVAFNTLPAAFTEDFTALRYLTSPNQVVSDAANHAPGIQNRGAFLVMNPLSHRCCQHNHSHGWSSFTKNLWSATADGGLAAVLYAPCTVRAQVGEAGAMVGLEVDTRYPFEDEVRLTVRSEEPLRFPLYLRIPSWCRAAAVRVNGEVQTSTPAPLGGAFVRVERTWREGDTVALALPMQVAVHRWAANHGAVSVRRGPLTYSLDIAERRVTRRADETALRDSQWQADVDLDRWTATELFADSPWNYGLVLDEEDAARSFVVEPQPWPADDFPFTQAAAPIALRATGRRIPAWRLDRHGLAAELQDGPVHSDQADEAITLVPMGGARLRISAFPVIASGDGGRRWEPPALPVKLFDARASHCYEGDTVAAVADGLEPTSSGDRGLPRLTFWPHLGTSEWVEASFEAPRTVSRVEVYWFDDREIQGACRPPRAWRLLAREGDTWRPVAPEALHGTDRDRYNGFQLAPFETTGLRLEIDLQEGFSAGVLEWKIR